VQGFDHSSPDKQARILASWGTFLGSEYTMDIANEATSGAAGSSSPSNWQGLTLVHFSAQLEPCLTHKDTPHTLNSP